MADFPRWKYSATEQPRIVNTKEEEDALEGVWGNSPAEFFENEPVTDTTGAAATPETGFEELLKKSRARSAATKKA